MGLADYFDLTRFLPLALFGTFSVLAWWLLDLVASNKPRAVERLAELKNPRSRGGEGSDAVLKRSDPMLKVLERASPALAKPLQPTNAIEIGKLKAKLAHAGFRSEGASVIFLGLKLVGLLAAVFIGGGAAASIQGFHQNTLLTTAVLVMIFFYLPDLVVGYLGKTRKEAVFLALPDALDLLVVCVEAGLGLDHAMRKVSDEMKRTYRVLSEELALTNFQLQMGRPCAEALHDLGANWRLRPPRLGRRAYSSRQVRRQYRPGAPRAKRIVANPPPTIGRGKGRQDGRQADIPLGSIHLSRHLCHPRGSRRHHDGPRHVPQDAGALRKAYRLRQRGRVDRTPSCGAAVANFSACAV